jgi:GAF domain-containing protein
MALNASYHQEEMNALLNAMQAILSFSSFEEAARVIFNEAKKVTGAKSGYVALLSKNGDENEVLFLDSGGLECTVDPTLLMPIRGLRNIAYDTCKAVYENDFMHTAWVNFMPHGHVILKNVLFAPLVIEEKPVGLIGLANKDGDFTDRDAFFAEIFGKYASFALYNNLTLDKLRSTVEELQKALHEVKTLKKLLPICASCKKIRDDSGYWHQVEEYLHTNSDLNFTHGLCPTCAEKMLKDLEK